MKIWHTAHSYKDVIKSNKITDVFAIEKGNVESAGFLQKWKIRIGYI